MMPEALQNRRGMATCRRATDRRLHQMSLLSIAKRFLAAFLAVLLPISVAQAAPAPQQAVTSTPRAQDPHTAQTQQQSSALPDAPSPQEAPQNAQQTASQSTSGQQQNSPASPVGTAAAPAEQPVGTTGSRPAGAVIAPAKQRRVHTFLISVALIAGAGIAIGTVAALSHASPSQPH
jgi:cytoskeletal protein RodZ